ncbi:hypothetical protein [Agreia sp.]|uniref:hypothetical protein n=1 Tax=Agreia sp. TaxID=1872416 RepID=UPI0035BBAA94
MAGGSAGQSRPSDIHLHASISGQTLTRLWQAGYGDRLRSLGDPFQVVFDGDGVRLHELSAPIDRSIASDWRAFIPWSDIDRIGLASVTLPGPSGSAQNLREAITIQANSTTIPLLVYSPATGLAAVLNGRGIDLVRLATAVNELRGRPDAHVNRMDLWREAVPELDPIRRTLAADLELPSRTADELLGDVVRREPVYGPSSERIGSIWRAVQYVAGLLLASGIVVVIVSLVQGSDFLRVPAFVIAVMSGVAIRIASSRHGTAARIALRELEAGYTLSRSGPVQVDQLDPATAIVIRRAGERALTPVEEKRARSAARLLDAGGPELSPSEWAVLRARQIISRGEDPEVAPAIVTDVRNTAAPVAPAWGTGSREPVPARHALLAGRHSRGISWYRRADLARRRAAEHAAGYTVSRTLRPDLDQVDPVTGYVIRPAGRARLARAQERAAAARVRILPPSPS